MYRPFVTYRGNSMLMPLLGSGCALAGSGHPL